MNLKDIEKLKIFECVAGSHAYGTNTPNSDMDIRGIFMLPKRQLHSLGQTVEQVSDSKNDVTFFELRRFFELALDCNPNIIELLWIPEDCIRLKSPLMKGLINNRDLFLSQKAYSTFSGYAYAQVSRAKGQNKWINCPKPETPPAKEDFCWIIDISKLGVVQSLRGIGDFTTRDDMSLRPLPFRPVPLKDSDIDLTKFHTSKMEHMEDVYRLYEYGDEAKGVFRGDGQLVVESIPMEDELTRFHSLLIYNEKAYDAAFKDWKNYWEWRKNRNEDRYRNQESGEVDFDCKNMLHCMRLLWSGRSIMQGNGPIVRFEGEQQKMLMDIRNGKFTYETIMEMVQEQMDLMEKEKEQSSLPYVVNKVAIIDLYLNLRYGDE